MKPRLHSALLTFWILATLAAACGGATPVPGGGTPVSTDPISFMVFGDPAEVAAFETVVEAYHASHPGTWVELIVIPSQSEYRQRLAADFAAGTPADVVLINYRRVAAFAAKGALEPLGPYLNQSKVIQPTDFYPLALEAFSAGGQTMCIPQNISSPVVYINKDLFDEVGLDAPDPNWNWADFLAAATSLTLDEDNDGQTDIYGLGIEPALMRLAPFVWAHGGLLLDSYHAPSRFTLDSGPDLEAFRWFVELQTKWHVVPDAVAEESEDSLSRFINGRMGMYVNSRREVPTLREAASFNWDVAPMPVGKFRVSILHADGYCVAASAKNKAAVWSFVEFANSVEGQTAVVATGRTVPSLVSVAESPAFLNPDQPPANSRVWLDAVGTINTFPLLSTWPEIEEIANKEIERAFYGQATVEEAARVINELSAQAFRLGVSGETD